MELLPSAYSSSQYENFGSTSKSFIWKLEFASNILWIIVCGNTFLVRGNSNSPHSTSSLIYLTIFVNLRPMAQF